MINLELMLASFGGGVLGALLGAIPAFIFTGMMGLIGVAVLAATGSDLILSNFAFGPIFGPHISFAGAVAAVAYEVNKRDLDSDIDITTPMFDIGNPKALVVGGIFGLIGHLINSFFVKIMLPTDTIALTVFLSGILARVIFGDKVLRNKGENKVWPNKKECTINLIWSLGYAVVISYLVKLTKINVIGFCISAFSLIFLQMGTNIPSSHHIALVAGNATIATNNIYIGTTFGAIAWFIGHISDNYFNKNNSTYIDSPSIAIFICCFIIFIFLQ